jgi:hypothetical protein
MIGHLGIAMETQHLCPASPLRGGLSGLAGVPPGIRPARCPRGGMPPAVERQLHLLAWGGGGVGACVCTQKVREVLTELELPYLLVSAGKG